MRKRPLDADIMLRRIRQRVAVVADAAMFELKDRGHGSLFEQLVACILSIRTRDEVSLPAALRLLAKASTPERMARLGPAAIDRLVHDVTFHEGKAHTNPRHRRPRT